MEGVLPPVMSGYIPGQVSLVKMVNSGRENPSSSDGCFCLCTKMPVKGIRPLKDANTHELDSYG